MTGTCEETAMFGLAVGGLIVLSVPWAILGWRQVRAWSLAIPFAFWLGFAWLESVGVLPGATDPTSALLAGAIGAVFTALGVGLRLVVRSRRAA